MRYSDPELIDLLALEYVTGTLSGRARSRFEALAKYRVDVRARITHWENLFLADADLIESVSPPEQLWQNLHLQLFGAASKSGASQSKPLFWQAWGAVATAASLAFLIIGINLNADLREANSRAIPNHVGVVGDQAEPLWVISADLTTGVLEARAINASARSLDQAFELWMLPEDGQPRSLGLLPVDGGRVEHRLPSALLAILQNSKGLAVSIEPAGGSPTGLPTGDVIQTAVMWEL